MSIHTGSGRFIHLRRNLRWARLRMWRAPAPPAAGLRTCQRKSYNRSLLSQLGNPLEKLWPKFVKSAARVRNSATISVTPTTSSGGAGMSTCGRYAPKFRAAAGGCGSAPAVCAAVKLRKLRILGSDFVVPLHSERDFSFPLYQSPMTRDGTAPVARLGNLQLRTHLFRQLTYRPQLFRDVRRDGLLPQRQL
jgi:hypothetical protein